MSDNNIRINKFLSQAGFCSRREADQYIIDGRVTINGTIAVIGSKINLDDDISVDGERISKKHIKKLYLMLNKPKGIVCTTDSGVEKSNIIDFINHPQRIFPIGRLDKTSEGLIFLTNDGDIVNKILRAKNKHEKEYHVTVNKPINSEFIKKMSSGVPILNTVTRRCKVKYVKEYEFKIILTQGLNRQIRRMCEHLGYRVKKLKRIRIMNIELDISIGEWRYFTTEELSDLKSLLSNSSTNYA
ncbi:MAG: 23S rRNA pseudouridine(2604) synthase RluF [Flavobacteriaceae bacterium]|jgi:23S rRNA pseudouridine2604 synthase|nr:23S rRNA pseudouridine(2604) synthase RluF [Flavobacteriaceae bacterium]MBT3753426.1 23S rRNA pseudouridine(2604) synthase RluF [Flavobacteriaceae bacterium]MBT4246404.1 23S rRNA pseudouridine(2604) synthase RluF [Flavobacteriaceae bacterium]MBT4416106.1 23S rRNA pseudouridine(2604) synthase RluF [Flavobacteriaceae bacterium]MBT5396297.1 23S rRNA pseudouridine(2604) synthase RluF [Flavobacteriaceae bacterium]